MNISHRTGCKAQIKPRFNFVFLSDPLTVEILHWLFLLFCTKVHFNVSLKCIQLVSEKYLFLQVNLNRNTMNNARSTKHKERYNATRKKIWNNLIMSDIPNSIAKTSENWVSLTCCIIHGCPSVWMSVLGLCIFMTTCTKIIK